MTDLPTREDFEAYEDVRSSGNFNMFSPMAREFTGLDKATYRAVMTHYDELCKLYPDVRKDNESLTIEGDDDED